ncbi:transporter [Candidatus Roizmanbacteria bacterium RIFCSPHIGHO2_02_FULL_37_13b]|uniref:Transporter n=1 Tax=Candidatus Roizmanbacteria bacterium RIFCSPLOWO2_02_FULL_36_11 TaxID=1802071 RepID=A0A1F7JII7_9BACT|nr:MAG: transporter [Candidatus Roizmanbacteria bacterium RIFCSPHIGHO2_02_FULL_37_13b]OGK55429.1 MAG: transporter [Candidatus Roizmanbacteria bacterium RIFCSPLOWO2_02_FULL_36_11]
MESKSLTKFALLSIFAAIVTISLKTLAFTLTGSVGLLSDALESIVNLVAAIIALLMLKIAEKPADENHMYGHTKAEYFSSIIEGLFILIAAISIIVTAGNRMLHPRFIEQIYLGLFISGVASIINLIVALKLIKVGKDHSSITLEADGHHLLTDVWTSVGVVIGLIAVVITKINILDPIIAILVGINIIITGYKIIKRSALGFMDTAIDAKSTDLIKKIFQSYIHKGIEFHGLRTRQSASRKFVSFHVLVPGSWTVQKGHDLLEKIEKEIRDSVPKTIVFTHLEPIEDPKSMDDNIL